MAGNLSLLQREHAIWVKHNFPNHTVEDAIFGAVEEIGELAHHYLKMKQGIRGEEEYHRTQMGDAVADCIVFLATVVDYLGLDYGLLVEMTWDHVKQRDWVNDPQTGGENG